jgi:hypothetical protein
VVTYGIARPVPGAGGMTDADWREFGSGLSDGIVNSTNPGGSSDFQVALSAADRTITLNLGQIRIRGVQFRPTPTTATVTFTLPAITTGQTRSDRIVARYDPAAADTDKITFIQVNGTAVAANPVRPSITRIAGGTWDVPLHLFTGGNVTSDTLTHEDHRIFVTSHLHGLTPPGNNTALNSGFPDGTQYFNYPTGETYVQTYPGGVATWTNLDDPPWTDLNIGGGIVTPAGEPRPAYRVRRGQVELQGHGVRANGVPWGPYTTLQEILIGTLPASLVPSVPHHWFGRVSGGSFSVIAGGSGGMYVGGVPLYVLPTGEIKITLYVGMVVAGVWYDPIRFTPKG